jgi:hypothetical protein
MLKEFVYFLFAYRVICPDTSSLLVEVGKHFVETADESSVFIRGAIS